VHSTNPLHRLYRRWLRKPVHAYAPALVRYYHRYFTRGTHRPALVEIVPATYWPNVAYRRRLAELPHAERKAIAA
jgi:hypothetical protein